MSLLPTSATDLSSANGGMIKPIGPSYEARKIPPPPQTPAYQGFDIWGPLQRRKHLIGLFCLIGAMLGLLYYSKTPKTYSSFTRLMITTQAPPAIINGDMQLERVSLSKHANLIASELVLSDAVSTGKLGELKSFQEAGFPVADLKGMIDVFPDEEAQATLTITCKGTQPDDLPIILNQIVFAYKKNLDEDTESFGRETAELIQLLSSQLMEEKKKAEERSLQLYTGLGITSVDSNGRIVNPYTENLREAMERFDEVKSSLRDLDDRYELLEAALKSNDENQIKIASLEASQYLKLSRPQAASDEDEFASQSFRLPGLLTRRELEKRISQYINELDMLQLDRVQFTQKLGPGHSRVRALDARIMYYERELEAMQEQLDTYAIELEKIREQSVQSTVEPDETDIYLKSLRIQEERQWIIWYQLAAERDRNRLSLKLDALGEDVRSLSGKAEAITQDVRELNMLRTQIAEKGEAIRVILERISGLDIVSKSYTTTKVKVLDPAGYGQVIAPTLPKSIALGTMLAFLAGVALAIFIDQGELSFWDPREISEKLHIPVVGRVPRIDVPKTKPSKGVPELVVAHSPGSTVSEAFRDIRTSLFFQANAEGIKTILFTSPSPGDGKSTTVANLAISIAQAGKRVILVDADFRRPRVDRYFEEPMEPGLVNVLVGDAPLADSIRPAELQEKLFLLTAGERPENPGELVASEAFRELIHELRGKFDFVLIDSPPVLPVSEPATIASIVDGVYMVTRIRKGIKLASQSAKEALDRVGTHWMGIIVNGLDENPHYSEYGYQYGVYSYYGERYGRYNDANNQEYRDKIASD